MLSPFTPPFCRPATATESDRGPVQHFQLGLIIPSKRRQGVCTLACLASLQVRNIGTTKTLLLSFINHRDSSFPSWGPEHPVSKEQTSALGPTPLARLQRRAGASEKRQQSQAVAAIAAAAAAPPQPQPPANVELSSSSFSSFFQSPAPAPSIAPSHGRLLVPVPVRLPHAKLFGLPLCPLLALVKQLGGTQRLWWNNSSSPTSINLSVSSTNDKRRIVDCDSTSPALPFKVHNESIHTLDPVIPAISLLPIVPVWSGISNLLV
ncbi:hypothetical protein CABS01_01888 [Colletotrichum abscissum]|uniref:uncharacterized protein n=1 Tax=Colletotrichum abscissum TaxID=1671311 RepID=UPI0027D4C24A|nr:uncharacterized protein CABS01_01888 [Colletotrichum abscissum]KAK1496081.1 hypothetical protein CABS01_01888 [Colletotrichum abscissum]